MDVLGGEDSETEAARRLIENRPSIREIVHEICDQIDQRYYSVSIDQDRGIAKTLWETTQRNTRMFLYADAVMTLDRHNMAKLWNSFSEIISEEGWQQYVRDAVAWAQWRSSWIYNTPVTVQLKSNMATPDQIRVLTQGRSLVPAQPDRSGEISGDEERIVERQEHFVEDEDNAISSDEDQEQHVDLPASSPLL